MMKLKLHLILLLFLSFLASSCAGPPVFHNMSDNDIKNERYFVQELNFPYSIKEIVQRTNTHSYNCVNTHFDIQTDPTNEKSAKFSIKTTGWSTLATIFLVDFKEDSAGHTTARVYDSGSIYVKKRVVVEALIQTIEHPEVCK